MQRAFSFRDLNLELSPMVSKLQFVEVIDSFTKFGKADILTSLYVDLHQRLFLEDQTLLKINPK
jgi:hypothetical protein